MTRVTSMPDIRGSIRSSSTRSGLIGAESLEGGRTVLRGRYVQALLGQCLGEGFANGWLVLDDEHGACHYAASLGHREHGRPVRVDSVNALRPWRPLLLTATAGALPVFQHQFRTCGWLSSIEIVELGDQIEVISERCADFAAGFPAAPRTTRAP